MKNTTAIATVNKAVIPPPKKAELIEALALRQRALQQAEYDKLQETTAAAEKAFRASLAEDLANPKKVIIEQEEVDYSVRYDANRSSRVLVSVYQCTKYKPSAKSVKLHAEWRKLADSRVVVQDLSVIKRELRAKVDGHTTGNRVKALLDNPETSKALDAMLKALSS